MTTDRTPSEHPVAMPPSGYQAIVDHIRREIVLGRIRPGDTLPAERKHAEQLGVARETLRQALRILEGSGQLARTHRGAFVVQAVVIEPRQIRADLELRAPQIRALAEFRWVVDAAAAQFAAERRTESDLAAMRAAQSELAASSDLHESRLADTAFHLAVARASGNPELARAVEDSRVKMFSPVDVLIYHFHRDSSLAGHARVLDAIEHGDGEAAATAMREHLSTTLTEFQSLIEDEPV